MSDARGVPPVSNYRFIEWCKRYALTILLCAVAVKGIVLAVRIPLWGGPDEPSHVQYVQTIVENRSFPVFRFEQQSFSPEIFGSLLDTKFFYGKTRTQIDRNYRPPASSDNTTRRVIDQTLPNPSALYSPAYYLIESVPYLVFYNAPLGTRVVAMRIVSSLMLVVTTLLAYRLALLVRRNRGFALTVASLVGFQPMASFEFSAVNNDALATMLSALLLYRLVRIVLRGTTMRETVWNALILGFVVSVKQSTAIFAPVWLLTVWLRKDDLGEFRHIVRHAVVLIALSFAVWAPWQLRMISLAQGASSAVLLRDQSLAHLPLASYCWLVLIYRLPNVFRSFWGNFGWLDKPLPLGLYVALAALSVASLAGAIRGLLGKVRDGVEQVERRAIAVICIAVVVMETIFVGWYLSMVLRYGYIYFPMQGRYYFPLLAGLMLLMTWGLERFVAEKNRSYVHAVLTCLAIALFAASVGPMLSGS